MNTEEKQIEIINQFKIDNEEDLKYIVSEDLKFISSGNMDKLFEALLYQIKKGDNNLRIEGLPEEFLQKVYKLYELLKSAE